MKQIKSLSYSAILILSIVSCKKYTNGAVNVQDFPGIIRFNLFTTKDFSKDPRSISFSVFIADSTKTLWDSTLPPMRIKDIPDSANALVIEKVVPKHTNSLLKVSFRYNIDNVGHSGYVDSSNAGQNLKVVNFNFQ